MIVMTGRARSGTPPSFTTERSRMGSCGSLWALPYLFLFVLLAGSEAACPHDDNTLIMWSTGKEAFRSHAWKHGRLTILRCASLCVAFLAVSAWNTADAEVTIAANQRVLLDVSPPKITSIVVQGSLIVDDADLSLNVDWCAFPLPFPKFASCSL